jgi:D-alanyl-D-alanine carboxypeptidase/D-alanyl-D-alanine-endopeptidase (penicillin-binding protein 4)
MSRVGLPQNAGRQRTWKARSTLLLVAVGLLLTGLVQGCARASRVGPLGSDRSAAERRASLSQALDALFESRPFHRALWGAEVVHLGTGETLYARNAQRHFMPASNMKLVVAATALEKLGPDYTYRTSVYTKGRLNQNGTLVGDLILYGRGDPNISGRYTSSPTAIFLALADSLRTRGVKRVVGRVIGDESYFDTEYTRPDWQAYDLLWWYAAPVSALSFNDNSIDFTIRPGPVGSPPRITGEPASRFYSLRNVAVTTAGPDTSRPTLDFTRIPGTNQIIAYGDLPLDANEKTESFAVVNPAGFTATVFRETLEQVGIGVQEDSVLVISDPLLSPVDSTATVLAEHVSPPLEKVILSINQRSQNWHAEQLLKTLGKEVSGSGSFAAGIRVEQEYLRSIGVEADAFRIRDASGLSTGNLLTPNALTVILRHMLRHRHGKLFLASLPEAGGEGSLRFRFSNAPASGAVHAKTGTLEHVTALSGYLIPQTTDTLAFSILTNNHGLETSQAIAAIDSAVGIVTRSYQR